MFSSLPKRFQNKIDVNGPGGCWLWLGCRDGTGYGRVYCAGRTCAAHRVVYELLREPVPVELDLDHVLARGCHHRSCVNPDHLEPVTRQVNLLRGPTTIPARMAAKTHCLRGHLLAGENLGKDAGRRCRECRRHRERGKEGSSRRRCMACGQMGHYKQACPVPPEQRSGVVACKNGHPYVEGSWRLNRTTRVCRLCEREHGRKHDSANRERRAARKRERRAALRAQAAVAA